MRVLFLLSAATLAAIAPAHAQTYGKVLGGGTLGVDHDFTAGPIVGEYDTNLGYTVGGALGRNFSDYLSLEGEVAYRSNEIDGPAFGGDDGLNALSFMANGVLHFPSEDGITPYVGAGAGGVRLAAANDHDLVFAYQAFGGLQKNFSENLSAGVEYRYLDANQASLAGGAFNTEYDSHGVNFVLTRKF